MMSKTCDIDRESLCCRVCGARVTRPNVLRNCGRGLSLGDTTSSVEDSIFGGPGTELKQLLSRVGIAAEPGCECNTHSAQMDRWGCDECERRLEEIVGWLQEEHAKRVKARDTILPWSKLLATNIVKLAIRRARRKESTGPN